MDTWILWIVVAALFVVAEVITQWVWTFCLAAGCLGAMVASLFGLPLPWQVAVLAVAAVVAYFACVPLMKRWYADSWRGRKHEARTGMDALLGRKAEVVEEIRPGELGRARIDGDYWQVKAPGVEEVIHRGKLVSVLAYDSIILTVEPLENT